MTSPIIPAHLSSGAFDNGVQTVWDSTSIKLAEECPRKYYYSMILGISSPGTNPHLRFGGLYATALETYYKLRANGVDYDTATIAVVRDAMLATWDEETNSPESFAHNAKTRWSLIRTIVWYLDEFGQENDETLVQTHHLSDGRPAVELSFKLPMEDDIMLSGHLDRVVTYAGQYFVMDQKTTGSTVSEYFFNQFKPDTQMSCYTLAGQAVFSSNIRGVMIDAAQIAVGFTRFLRGFTNRTHEELEEWWTSAKYTIQFSQYLSSKGPREENFPMRASSCGNYGGCPFRPICSTAPQHRERFIPTAYQSKLWDPTENR